MLQQIFLIAKNTYLETVRDRVIVGAFIISVFSLLLALFVGSISFDQSLRIIVDLGLSTVFLLQVFIVLFVGSHLFQREIDRKTLFLLLPKVAKRENVILGKALGLFLVIVAVSLLNTGILAVLVTLKGGVSYLQGIAIATLFSFLEMILLIFLSLFLSLFTSAIFSTLIGFSLFLIGHSQSILLAVIEKTQSEFVALFLKVFYYILPNLEKCNVRNDVIYKTLPSLDSFLLTGLYMAVYSVLIFSLAKILINKKEF